jgi:hypothetical protein
MAVLNPIYNGQCYLFTNSHTEETSGPITGMQTDRMIVNKNGNKPKTPLSNFL